MLDWKPLCALALLTVPATPQSGSCKFAALWQPGATSGEHFGYALALEGDRMVVGARLDDDGAINDAGSAWVFDRAGNGWIPVQQLDASLPGKSDYFGSAVAVAGGVIVVGAPGDNVQGLLDVGSAYVFELQGSSWVETARLGAPVIAKNARFGGAVAASADHVFVGGPGKVSIFVYERSGTTWTQTDVLTTPSLIVRSLSVDGDSLVVGTGTHCSVYRLVGSSWTLEATINDPPGFYSSDFGDAVDLDGDRLIVGAPEWYVQGVTANAGTSFVYERIGTVWGPPVELASTNAVSHDDFGYSVALHGDLAAVGDPLHGTGVVTLFERTDAGWMPLDVIEPGMSSEFGHAVAFDGHRLLVGNPLADLPPAGTNAGAVRTFGIAPVTYCSSKPSSPGCVPAIGSSGTPSAAGPFDVFAAGVVNNKSGLFFYGTSGRANLPFLGGRLCVQPGLQRTPITGSGGNPPPDDCSGVLSFDLAAWIAAGTDPALVPGAALNGQFWFLDPAHPDGTGVGLSDAIELAVCP